MSYLSRLAVRASGVGALITSGYYLRDSGLSSVSYPKIHHSYAEFVVPFDHDGFPTESVPTAVSRNAQPLYLSGVGMRRKNLYIVEVDIYKVALCLSADALKKGKEAVLSGRKMSDLLLDDENTSSSTLSTSIPALSVPLVFVRSVSTHQVVEAFNDAFVGCNQEGINLFKDKLREVVGTAGMKVGETVTFYWVKGGGIIIAKNNLCGGIMRNTEIEKRLLDVYIDPSRTVSPDLVKCIQSYIKDL